MARHTRSNDREEQIHSAFERKGSLVYISCDRSSGEEGTIALMDTLPYVVALDC